MRGMGAAGRLPAVVLALVVGVLGGVLGEPFQALTAYAVTPAWAATEPAGPRHEPAAGTHLVTVAAPELADEVAVLLGAGQATGAVTRIAPRVLRVEGRPPGAEDLPGVEAVEPNGSGYRFLATPSDPGFGQQWGHVQTGITEAWSITTGDPGVTVAVVDSGLRGDHEDLVDNVVEQVSTGGGEVQTAALHSNNDVCGLGHGTQVAGVVGARGDNGLGVAGVAWRVGIVDIRVVELTPECHTSPPISDDAVTAALSYAVNRPGGPVDVVNLSLGGPDLECPTAVQAAVDDARAAGVVVVAAAGNLQGGMPGHPSVPASCHGVVSVGATGEDRRIADYSSQNGWVDLVAPGGADRTESDVIVTTGLTPPDYVGVAGTSFSAPYVAGVAALLRSFRPALTPDEIESLLERTATDLGTPGRDDVYGWGLVRPAEALEWLVEERPIPAPRPDPEFPVGDSGGSIEAPTPEPEAIRLDSGATTEAIPQAVAVSESIFDPGEADWAVVARSDDFADALAGSGLAFGVAPLLFTSPSGALARETRDELARAVTAGGDVYLLGGSAALPESLEAEILELGFNPVRLAGRAREETAVRIAQELDRRRISRLPYVLLATSHDWPDAVAGGSMAAWFGLPILLSPRDALHPATAQALDDLRPERIYVLGGTAALSDVVVRQAGTVSGVPAEKRIRLAGAARDGTAVAVAFAFEALLFSEDGLAPPLVVAVNVRRRDAFAHALSASMIAGTYGAPFVPIEGNDGTVVTDPAKDYLRGTGFDLLLAGGEDLISEEVADELTALSRPADA